MNGYRKMNEFTSNKNSYAPIEKHDDAMRIRGGESVENL